MPSPSEDLNITGCPAIVLPLHLWLTFSQARQGRSKMRQKQGQSVFQLRSINNERDNTLATSARGGEWGVA